MYTEIKTESQLVEVLANKLTTFFNTDIAVTELSAGYGIVDLAFAKNYYSTENKIGREPINNYLALKIILSFEGIEFSLSQAMSVTGTSEITCRKLIKNLLQADYIQLIKKQTYITNYPVRNPIKKIVAIEAKLRDWKQGILQARRYKSFTDECYLAILSQYEKNIEYSYLEKFGIGLILFNPENGKIQFKKKPIKNQFLQMYSDDLGLYAKEAFLHQSWAKTLEAFPSMSVDTPVSATLHRAQ